MTRPQLYRSEACHTLGDLLAALRAAPRPELSLSSRPTSTTLGYHDLPSRTSFTYDDRSASMIERVVVPRVGVLRWINAASATSVFHRPDPDTGELVAFYQYLSPKHYTAAASSLGDLLARLTEAYDYPGLPFEWPVFVREIMHPGHGRVGWDDRDTEMRLEHRHELTAEVVTVGQEHPAWDRHREVLETAWAARQAVAA